jgi:membrane fusion protein (multidrug efflux system)
VVGKDGKVEQRPVNVGEWYGDDWFILHGLQAGERVVVDGGLTLRSGVSVETKPYETEAGSALPGIVPKAGVEKDGK